MIFTAALKENRDFRRIYAKGTSYAHAYLVLYVSKNRLGINRLGITVNKKLGNAVYRNRVRRILKEGFREASGDLPRGYDFILVARSKTGSLKSTDIKAALDTLFIKHNLKACETCGTCGRGSLQQP